VAAALLIPVGAVAGCGSEDPTTPSAQAPGQVAPDEQNGGTTAELGSVVDVVDARIPAPAKGVTQAQFEMTLAVVKPGTSVALTSVSTPAARSVELLSHGHAATRISVPVAAGTNVQFGPPAPTEILLIGLTSPLKLGQSVKVTLTFDMTGGGESKGAQGSGANGSGGQAGSGTLTVPVTAAP
jgi:copper(I)-binding protein